MSAALEHRAVGRPVGQGGRRAPVLVRLLVVTALAAAAAGCGIGPTARSANVNAVAMKPDHLHVAFGRPAYASGTTNLWLVLFTDRLIVPVQATSDSKRPVSLTDALALSRQGSDCRATIDSKKARLIVAGTGPCVLQAEVPASKGWSGASAQATLRVDRGVSRFRWDQASLPVSAASGAFAVIIDHLQGSGTFRLQVGPAAVCSVSQSVVNLPRPLPASQRWRISLVRAGQCRVSIAQVATTEYQASAPVVKIFPVNA